MESKELSRQYQERANNEREAGSTIEINNGLPSVSLTMSDGASYFFQEHEADNILNEAKETIKELDLDLSVEDYILAIAQNW